jgi:WD40 repeat protein
MRRAPLGVPAIAGALCLGHAAAHPAAAGEPRVRSVLRAGYGNALAMAFSPDGTTLAAGCGKDPFDGHGEVQLWDVAAATCRATLTPFKGAVTSVAFAGGTDTLAVGSADGTVTLWESKTGKARPFAFRQDYGYPYAVAFSPNGRHLAAGSNDRRVRLWDLTAGTGPTVREHVDWVTSVAFAPDGATLASAGWDAKVKLWDVPAAGLRATLKGPLAIIWAVAYAPDGATIAAGYEDGTVGRWDTATGKPQAALRGEGAVKCLAFSPDGKTLAAGTDDRSVLLWDVPGGTLRTTLRGHAGPVTGVAFAPGGGTLAAASGSEVRLWELAPTRGDGERRANDSRQSAKRPVTSPSEADAAATPDGGD